MALFQAASNVALWAGFRSRPLLKVGGCGYFLPLSLKWRRTPAWSEMSSNVGKIYVVPPMLSIGVGIYIRSILDCIIVSSLYAFVQVKALLFFLRNAPRLKASHTPSMVSSLFHASSSLVLMLVIEDPPCLSLALSILLKSPTSIHSTSGRPACARWFHNIALGLVWLNPYLLMMPICRRGLRVKVAYWAIPGYSVLWSVMEVARRADNIISVPSLNCLDWTENEPSFQRLLPPQISRNGTCLRHAASSSFVSCKSKMSVVGMVCLKRCWISLHFFHPRNPCPRLPTFCVAIVRVSPFMQGWF